MSLGKRTFYTTPLMREYIDDILTTGRLSYGKYSKEFESKFASMHGCKYGVLSNSGTSSLLVALQTLKELHGWQDGDEVIVPAITFVSTVNVVLQLGFKPVLVDVEGDYYGIDTDKIEQAITNRTRCIIPVHTFGQPYNIKPVNEISIKFLQGKPRQDILTIIDSCESMLVKGNWPPFADIACFSTYTAHLLVTGVGGLAITNISDYALYMRSLVNHGIDLSELPIGEDYDPTWLARKFNFTKIGHSFRVTELEAALGLAQLDDLSEIIRKRQSNAAYLTEKLKCLDYWLQLPAIRPNTDHSFMMFVLVCKQEGTRDSLCRYLESKGIGTRLALPLTRQPCYKGLWNPDDYPVADWMNRNAFYVGIHQQLDKEDLDFMAQTLNDYFAL